MLKISQIKFSEKSQFVDPFCTGYIDQQGVLPPAFPDDMGGLYEPEEINTVNMEDLPEEPVNLPEAEKVPNIIEAEDVQVIEPNEDDVAKSLFG